MKNITVIHGASSATVAVDANATVSTVLTRVQAALGIPENYNALIGGEVVSPAYVPANGATIVAERRMCTKA